MTAPKRETLREVVGKVDFDIDNRFIYGSPHEYGRILS